MKKGKSLSIYTQTQARTESEKNEKPVHSVWKEEKPEKNSLHNFFIRVVSDSEKKEIKTSLIIINLCELSSSWTFSPHNT